MWAMVGPNVGLTNFGSIIVRAVADEYYVGLVSKSTEETISKLEEYKKKREVLNVNRVKKNSKVIIGSMDIDKWYTSMLAEPSANGVRKMNKNQVLKLI